MATQNNNDLPIVSPSLIKWKPVFIEQFDLGIGEEWLPHVGLADETSEELSEITSDVTEWLSSIPDVGSVMDCDEDESLSGEVKSKDKLSDDFSVKPTPKRLKLSLSKSKITESKALDKAATCTGSKGKTTNTAASGPLKDCTDSLNCSRFVAPVSSPEREKAARGVIPANTQANSNWAVKNFKEWASNRSAMAPDDPVPPDLLKSQDTDLLCKWLCRYVMETRRTDGSLYPPSTLRSLLSGVNRALQENKAPFSILDKDDYRFKDLLKTLDTLCSDLHRQGIGSTKNSAKVIELDDEDIFWQKGLLGFSTPKLLQHTVFFYVGLNFVLRGVQEQHDLIPSQFSRVPQDKSVYNTSVYYEYTELVSKNNQHRFKDINTQNKVIRAYALPGNRKCIVKMLDKYLSLLPPDAPYFYMRANEKFCEEQAGSTFTRQRVGVNMLKTVLPLLSKESGIEVRYTNHSLRATAITRMFNSGVEEKIIAETSGHRSTKALRMYEHTSHLQMKQVTRVINQSKLSVEQHECDHGKNPGEDNTDVKMNDQSAAQSILLLLSLVLVLTPTFQEHLATVLSMFASNRQVISF